MKKTFLLLSLILTSYCFSQSVNDYKAVIIPLKYDFLKSENQYRLQTLTKVNLVKAGFQAFYSNETIPTEFNDRCSLLYVDVKNEKAFFVTKLFKDNDVLAHDSLLVALLMAQFYAATSIFL